MTARSQGLVVTILHSFLQQFLSRLLPFFFNFSVRSTLTPEDAAISSVYIPLLYAIIQGLCREGVRRGCLRAKCLHAANAMAQTFIPWTMLVSSTAVLLFAWYVPDNADGAAQPGYQGAMKLVWLALTIDAFVEPLYIRGVYQGETRFEMQVEVAARTAEAFIVWLTVTFPQMHHSPAVSFALGCVTYSTVVALAYSVKVFALGKPAQDIQANPDAAEGKKEKGGASTSSPSKQDLSVCAIFTWQGAQKMLLQEASRIALSTYSARATGIYGEVQNLGSVVVRMVFWPIENAAYRAFTDSGSSNEEMDTQQMHRHLPQMQLLLRIVLFAALLACAFGPNYAFSAIHVLLSHRWSSTEAPVVLASYTAYLLCLAVNGVLEAYIHARMSPKELLFSNSVMVGIVLLQAACIAVSKQIGESCVALVAIDCFSMLLRVGMALAYIRRWHREYRGAKMAWLPSMGGMAMLGLAAFVTWLSNQRMHAKLGPDELLQRLPTPLIGHAGVGSAVLACVLFSCLRFESDVIRSLRSKGKRHAE